MQRDGQGTLTHPSSPVERLYIPPAHHFVFVLRHLQSSLVGRIAVQLSFSVRLSPSSPLRTPCGQISGAEKTEKLVGNEADIRLNPFLAVVKVCSDAGFARQVCTPDPRRPLFRASRHSPSADPGSLFRKPGAQREDGMTRTGDSTFLAMS